MEGSIGEPLEQAFERDGYVVVRDAISRERADEIRAFLMDRLGRRGGAPEREVVADCYVAYPETLDTLLNEKGVAALRELLGEDFVVLPDSCITIDRWNVLHTDTSSWEVADLFIHKEPEFRMVTVGLYLQDAEEGGGGLYVVPGSHKKADVTLPLRRRSNALLSRLMRRLFGGKSLDERLADLPEDREGLNIPSRAGDMVIFDMRMLHRSQRPEAASRPAPEGGRIAFFSRCVRNVPEHVERYVEYMRGKPDGAYLNDPERRPSPAMEDAARKHGIRVL